MIKNYIFDFGKVLVDFDPLYMTSVFVNDLDDAQEVCEVIFDRKYWNLLDSGDITDDAVKKSACERLPERLREIACTVYDHWIDNIPPIHGMRKILEQIRAKGKGLYLLSNISKGFAESYHTVPVLNDTLSLFDGLVFSGPIGLVKPDVKIFTHLLNSYSLKPTECLFIDDNSANIEAARKLGIKTYLFDGKASALAEFIESHDR